MHIWIERERETYDDDGDEDSLLPIAYCLLSTALFLTMCLFVQQLADYCLLFIYLVLFTCYPITMIPSTRKYILCAIDCMCRGSAG